jgi:hypothetical protein
MSPLRASRPHHEERAILNRQKSDAKRTPTQRLEVLANFTRWSKFLWLSNGQNQERTITNSIYSPMPEATQITLTQYGMMAEKHWRQFLPKMVKELETTGKLRTMLLEAEEKTEEELSSLRRKLMNQGLTAQQAHDQAWEIVREKYIFLTPETASE